MLPGAQRAAEAEGGQVGRTNDQIPMTNRMREALVIGAWSFAAGTYLITTIDPSPRMLNKSSASRGLRLMQPRGLPLAAISALP